MVRLISCTLRTEGEISPGTSPVSPDFGGLPNFQSHPSSWQKTTWHRYEFTATFRCNDVVSLSARVNKRTLSVGEAAVAREILEPARGRDNEPPTVENQTHS